jgi:hypothetical protein
MFGGPTPTAMRLKELARLLKRWKPLGRGRPRVDVPEMTVAELLNIPRSCMSRKQRSALQKVKQIGRPSSKAQAKRTIVELVRQLQKAGYTLTSNSTEVGSAFIVAAERLKGHPHAYSATAIRNIWQRYRLKFP